MNSDSFLELWANTSIMNGSICRVVSYFTIKAKYLKAVYATISPQVKCATAFQKFKDTYMSPVIGYACNTRI